MINRLAIDLNNMKMMINAFDGEYFVQNFQIYGGTEYIREYNRKTNYMNASGYTGEYTLNKIIEEVT